MKRNGLTIPAGILLALLALSCTLLAPVAAMGQLLQPTSASVMAAGGCGSCHDDAGQTQQGDDCGTSSACSCACHAPLTIAAVAVPLPVALASSFSAPTPSAPPQVYLPIFVPPQNRS